VSEIHSHTYLFIHPFHPLNHRLYPVCVHFSQIEQERQEAKEVDYSVSHTVIYIFSHAAEYLVSILSHSHTIGVSLLVHIPYDSISHRLGMMMNALFLFTVGQRIRHSSQSRLVLINQHNNNIQQIYRCDRLMLICYFAFSSHVSLYF
jgi:hypothetical protein